MGFWKIYYKKLLKKSALWSIFYVILSFTQMGPGAGIVYIIGVYITCVIIIFLTSALYYYIKGTIKHKLKNKK